MFDSYASRASHESALALCGPDVPTRVFLNRHHFERGIVGLLQSEPLACAVLHVTLTGEDGSVGAVCQRTLNVAGNILRACMRGGAAAYLGEGEFAVLLQGTDARGLESYACTVLQMISGLQMSWGNRPQQVQVFVGGTLAGDCLDGAILLAQAISASRQARMEPFSRLHLLDGVEPQEFDAESPWSPPPKVSETVSQTS